MNAYSRHNGSHKAAPAAEDGENTNDKLSSSKADSDHVGREHPVGGLVVGIEAILHLVWEYILSSRVLEVPDFDGVEPEVGLAVRAGDGILFLLAIVIGLTLAVIPQADRVEVLQLLGGSRGLEGLQQFVVEICVGDVW